MVRVGLTTCSGNERLFRVVEKVSMQMEAPIQKVRYYNDYYYDSIRMGMLRKEWERTQKKSVKQVEIIKAKHLYSA